MNNLTGIILAGGKSSRMGKDKGLVKYAGKAMVEYSLEICRQLCNEILISTANPDYAVFGYPLIEDEIQDIGPIGGIYAALKRAGNSLTIILPCDTPFLKKELFELLVDKAKEADIVVPYTEELNMEPLCACYSKTLLPLMEKQIAEKDFKLQNLIERAQSKKIKIDNRYEFYTENLFSNMNNPKDLIE